MLQFCALSNYLANEGAYCLPCLIAIRFELFFSFSFLVWFGLSLPSLATQGTYQAGGVCRQINCTGSKINSHFLLAMHESLTAIRNSRDSRRGNFLEKSSVLVIKSGDQRPGKQGQQTRRHGLREKPKQEGRKEGRNGMETYCLAPLNIPNKLATHADQPGANLSRILSRFAKNSISTRSKICRAKNPRSLATRGTIPWNNSSGRFKRTFQAYVSSYRQCSPGQCSPGQ